MAVFSLSALLVLLALLAYSATQPWGDRPVAPGLSLAPDLGATLGEAVAVAPSAGPALAGSGSVTGGDPRLAANAGVGRRARKTGPRIGIAAARPVGRSAPAPAPPPASPGAPIPAPLAPSPVAVPVATPVVASDDDPEPAASPAAERPASGGGQHGPTAAGVDLGLPFASFRVEDGGVYLLSLSFQVGAIAYLPPGEDNLLVQFNSSGAAGPSLGLQLWDDGLGGRGLWSSGEATGGERFLAALSGAHLLEVYFQASGGADGFYLAFLDGEAIDAGAGVSLIGADAERGTVEVGLFREGEFLPAGPEVVFMAASLVDAPDLLPD